jgi:NAD(P)-dependent dehydrogenase (short-subunit alcohol dehydrogenase family)
MASASVRGAAQTAALFSVSGRTVIVTGGLGLLGRQFTSTLAACGARVAVFDSLAETACDEDDVLVRPVDVTDAQQLRAGLAAVERRWGVPHALITCAAIDFIPGRSSPLSAPLSQVMAGDFEHVLNVNITGTFLACQVIGSRMAEAGRGSIITIASIYGLVGPDQRIYQSVEGIAGFEKPAAYSTSKAAVLGMTRHLATYWGSRNVRVNAMVLGGVLNNQNEQFVANYRNRVPLGRMACPGDYDGLVIFLVSDASSYLTGAAIVADGGWTSW